MSFINAVAQLLEVKNMWLRGELKPWPYAQERERLLNLSLAALAEDLGSRLKPIGRINVNGEVLISAAPEEEYAKYRDYCGKFGETFAKLLNSCTPRCGIAPGAIMHADSGWCYINHFLAEKMVMSYYAEVTAA